MTIESVAFAATLLAGVVGVGAAIGGYGKVAFFGVTAVFLLSSWVILGSQNAAPGTDGQAMMWGVMLVGYVFSLILMFALRKRTDAIF